MKTKALLYAVLAAVGPFLTSPPASAQQLLQGHVPEAVARLHLQPTGRLPGTNQLALAIGLPLRDREALTNLLQRLYDPASPDYHHFLTPAQFAETFGPTKEDYQAVTAFAIANGLRVTATHSNRALLDVAGSVADIEKAFHVTLRTYAHPREKRVFYAPDTEPALDLATPVLHVSGMDNYILPRPMSLKKAPAPSSTGGIPQLGSGPSGSYLGNDFRAAYVPGLSLTGTGQTVGLLEFDSGYYQADVTSYEGLAGLPNVPVKAVLLDGYDGGPGYGNDEVSLDIEMAISMAPGLASVIVYEGSTTDDILNRMATDGLANQLSASWTYGIDAESDQIFQQFAAQGQSFFNASGDGDAYVDTEGYYDSPAPPTDDPNLTSVGGTTLTTSGPGGAWVSETVWNWDVEYGSGYDGIGSSGGISITYPIPAWQVCACLNTNANQASTTFRNLPDVALTADNVYVVYANGGNGIFGGTSCATPLWAAFTALANEQAVAGGRPTLGFINPAIYAIGCGPNYTNCFHDITTGNNTWSESPFDFQAVPGYDLCTGWGTPCGTNLINLLAPPDALQISPAGGWAASGPVGGPLTPASQVYTLTDGGNAPLNWAVGATVPWLNISLGVSINGGTLTPGGPASTVTVSLNAASGNLYLGTYATTLWFTNLTDGVVQSRPFVLTVIKPPVITAQPAGLTLIGGTTAAFSAGVAGGLPLNCQWQQNGTNVPGGGRISGARSALTGAGKIYGSTVCVLTISNVTASDAGNYSLVASNAAGVAISSNALLTVTPSGPVIIQQPASQTVAVGATVQLAVVADGSTPFTYQWRLNQTNLTDGAAFLGSATPVLTINGASSADIGTYSVVVSNALGSATSTGAVLAVVAALPGTQLLQNGGFETGSFAFWGESGNFVDCSVASGFPAIHSGNYGALVGPAGALGLLSQSLPTVPGQVYFLSLWLNSPDGLAPNEFMVAWNGTSVFDETNLGAMGWTNLQFYVTATGSNTVLQLGFQDDQSFLGLDDIQVTPVVTADGPPIIVMQPANQVALSGGAATFAALSSGRFPLSYQWQFGAANVANATNATLTLSNLSIAQAGNYHVFVTNSLGAATSSNALLTVLTNPPELITFDDLPGTELAVPVYYHELTWSNFYYLDGLTYGQPSGYTAGVVSSPNVAYNAYGAPAAISAPAPFALLSAYLTAAWEDNLEVQVKGYNGATLVYNNTYTLNATNPALIQFNYTGVTTVEFIAFGGTPDPGYGGNSGEQFVLDNVTVVPTPPTPMTVLYSFNGADGGNPAAGLVQGADGNFYGTTENGGTNDYGAIIRLTTNGTLTTLLSFNYANGAWPYAGLVQGTNGNFYGTASEGGANGGGTVFRVATNGVLTNLFSFDYSVDGGYPAAGLVLGADGNFYGTTEDGGTNGFGTVFKITPSGALTSLFSFDSTNGAYPEAGLAQGADGNFYGTTEDGGTNDDGTVFKITPNGVLTNLFSFNYSVNGGYPVAGLVLGADGNFYGTTEDGGINGGGTVFRITTNGALTTLYSFSYTDGANPAAGLVQGADGNFYGTTEGGGLGQGTIFKMATNGALITLFYFEGTNGLSPQAGLVQGADGDFYGTTFYGGLGYSGAYSSGDGVVFRLGAVPAAAAPVITAQPLGQIVPVSGTAVFGVTAGGAAPLSYTWTLDGGAIPGATQPSYTNSNVALTASGGQFSCVIGNAHGSVTSSIAALTVFNGSGPLFSFHGADGGDASGALVQGADGDLYGTTQYGGTNYAGTVFRMTTNGLLTTLASFSYYVNGANPAAGLVQGADGNFYGTTEYGGAYGSGTVFRMATNGVLTNLFSFDYTDGANPAAGLVQGADGNFYGTAQYGGDNYYGTVFRIGTNGILTTLASFNDTNGSYPYGGLVQGADGNFYGTTANGGTFEDGTVFKLTTSGVLANLLSFDYTDGAYPYAGLVQGADGNFYGTTEAGGINGEGTVFKVTTNGALNVLYSFDYTDGANPYAGLVQGTDGNFYGTTEYGGTYGEGTAFRMTPSGTLTNLFSFNDPDGAYPYAGLVQGADGNLYGTTTEGGNGYDGGYGSGNGTVFRLVGAIVSGPPQIFMQPASQTNVVGSAVTFCVTAEGSLPLYYYWLKNGTNLPGGNSSCYTAEDVQLVDSGSQFSCLVSNAYGSALSFNATLTVVPASSNLVLNGGFELGTFAYWTTYGNFEDCGVSTATTAVHSGEYGASLGPVGTLGYLSQTLYSTIPGQLYQISCWLYSDGETPNEFSVSWNGTNLFDQQDIGLVTWTNLQFHAGATAANTVLAFGFRDDPSYFGLDDIVVSPLGPSPRPTPGNPVWANGKFSFSWSAVANQNYQVQYTTNLTQNVWFNWGGVYSTTNSSITVTDSPASTMRFYRLKLNP